MRNEGKSQQATARQARLQGALRENLRRRKEQARGRAGQEAYGSPEDEAAAEAPQPAEHAKPRRPG